MADALTNLHQLFQEIPDFEAMAVDKTVLQMQSGFTIPVKKMVLAGEYNESVKWFSKLALLEEVYLNHSRSMVPFRGNAWVKIIFLDDQFKIELLEKGQVVQEEILLVSSEQYCTVKAQNENQEIRFTLVTPGKFRQVRKSKEHLDNLANYLHTLKQELISSLEMKHNISTIKEWMKVLGIMSPKENVYFKDRPEIKSFLESRPLTLIPVKDCLHLKHVIDEMARAREVSDQVFFERPAELQYRKLLKLTLAIE